MADIQPRFLAPELMLSFSPTASLPRMVQRKRRRLDLIDQRVGTDTHSGGYQILRIRKREESGMTRVTGDGLGFSRRDFVVKGAAAGAALAASSVAGTGSADAMRGS